METLTIKIKDNKALKLIHDLEDLNLIQVIGSDLKKNTAKLSDILNGSISKEQADNMQKELKQTGAKYLPDTNTVIDFSSHKLPDTAHKTLSAIIDLSPQISIINKIELLSLSDIPRQIVFFTQEAYVFPLNEDIVAKTIELRKKYKIKLPDAIIAATALVFNLVLITHNSIDFKNIKSLKLIDPYVMDSKSI